LVIFSCRLFWRLSIE